MGSGRSGTAAWISYPLGGRDVSKLDDDALSDVRGREIGFIFQSFNLIPQLTVLENLEVPLFYQGRVGPELVGGGIRGWSCCSARSGSRCWWE